MSQRLAERVLARLKARSEKSYAHNRASFLSLLEEIKEAFNEGLSLKAIWETLHEEGKINFKYDTFLRYARKYLDNPDKNTVHEKPARSSPRKSGKSMVIERTVSNKERERTPAPDTQTFAYNPNHNLEDFT